MNEELTQEDIERQRRYLNDTLEDMGLPQGLVPPEATTPNPLGVRQSLVENLSRFFDRRFGVELPRASERVRRENAERRLAFATGNIGENKLALSKDLQQLVGEYNQFRIRRNFD